MGRPREPERTCVGCREKGAKQSLLRVVRSPEGRLAVDGTGKAPGRGAYVHPDHVCLEAAFRRGAMARALRSDMSAGEAARLMSDIKKEAAFEGSRTG